MADLKRAKDTKTRDSGHNHRGEGKCYWCNVKGHFKRECPQRRSQSVIRPWKQSAWFRSLLEEMDCDEDQFRRLQAILNHEERHSMGVGCAPDTIVIPGGMETNGLATSIRKDLGPRLEANWKRRVRYPGGTGYLVVRISTRSSWN